MRGGAHSSRGGLPFRGLPFFAPEVFRRVEVTTSLTSKQLNAGLHQLGEEGTIQIFHRTMADAIAAYKAFDRRESGWVKVELRPETEARKAA